MRRVSRTAKERPMREAGAGVGESRNFNRSMQNLAAFHFHVASI
jgi:hypothetical protein